MISINKKFPPIIFEYLNIINTNNENVDLEVHHNYVVRIENIRVADLEQTVLCRLTENVTYQRIYIYIYIYISGFETMTTDAGKNTNTFRKQYGTIIRYSFRYKHYSLSSFHVNAW